MLIRGAKLDYPPAAPAMAAFKTHHKEMSDGVASDVYADSSR